MCIAEYIWHIQYIQLSRIDFVSCGAFGWMLIADDLVRAPGQATAFWSLLASVQLCDDPRLNQGYVRLLIELCDFDIQRLMMPFKYGNVNNRYDTIRFLIRGLKYE